MPPLNLTSLPKQYNQNSNSILNIVQSTSSDLSNHKSNTYQSSCPYSMLSVCDTAKINKFEGQIQDLRNQLDRMTEEERRIISTLHTGGAKTPQNQQHHQFEALNLPPMHNSIKEGCTHANNRISSPISSLMSEKKQKEQAAISVRSEISIHDLKQESIHQWAALNKNPDLPLQQKDEKEDFSHTTQDLLQMLKANGQHR